MERIVVGRSATLTKTFYSDGIAADPDAAPTVAVTRTDGTPVTTGAVTHDGVGVYSVTIPASSNTLLDTLTVTWTATVNTESQTYTDIVEVAGGFYFGIADIRSVDPLGDEAKYPTDRITQARTLAETALEDACGVAFVPRYTVKTVRADGGTVLQLDPKTTKVRSASKDGVALTAGDLAGLSYDSGFVAGSTVWSAGYWTVGYEHGYPACPPWVSRASMLLARWFLVESPIDDRFTSVSTQDGTFTMVTPGLGGAGVAIPEVNSVVEQYRLVTV